MNSGTLYIVATPIGNLGDFTQRAQDILVQADLVCAEDTRHSKRLLSACGLSAKRMLSLHDHNEGERVAKVLASLEEGQAVALVSDAGTPLISDPGYRLVTACLEAGWRVSPVPGASALTAALSVAGLPTDRFLFAGFPPAKEAGRRQWLAQLQPRTETLIFYESKHRILASLAAMVEVLGAERKATLMRELTKQFETVLHGALSEIEARVVADENHQRGEFVLVVAGAVEEVGVDELQARKLLALLIPEVGVKRASELSAAYLGQKKNAIYKWALEIAGEK